MAALVGDGDRAFAVEELQILVRDDKHATHTWHHQILLRRLRDAEWVVCTSSEMVESVDLATNTLVALAPGSLVGAAQAGDCLMCDRTVVDRLPALHAHAARRAATCSC